MTDLTQDRLKDLLSYDPETGIFRRKLSGSNRIKAGAVTGAVAAARGYALIYLDGRRYYAHRLAWLYIHGAWPTAEIDHINRNRLDNRMDNLRLATRSQNNANTSTRAASGYRGVYRDDGRYKAQITVNGKSLSLGSFNNQVDAHHAYLRAAAQYYGEFSGCCRRGSGFGGCE